MEEGEELLLKASRLYARTATLKHMPVMNHIVTECELTDCLLSYFCTAPCICMMHFWQLQQLAL